MRKNLQQIRVKKRMDFLICRFNREVSNRGKKLTHIRVHFAPNTNLATLHMISYVTLGVIDPVR